VGSGSILGEIRKSVRFSWSKHNKSAHKYQKGGKDKF